MRHLAIALPILVGTTVLLSACQSKPSTTSRTQPAHTLVQRGNQALNRGDYTQATAYYDSARVLNPTTSSQHQYTWATQLSHSHYLAEQHQFSQALTTAKKVAKTAKLPARFKQAAHALITTLKTTIAQRAALTKQLKQARQALTAGQLTTTQKALTALFNQPTLMNTTTQDLYMAALQLQTALAQQQLVAAKTAANTTAKANTSSAQSSADTSSTAQNGEYHNKANQDTSITAADIKTARQQLAKAGVSEQAWSDADIRAAIQHARKAGRNTVTKADMTNYKD